MPLHHPLDAPSAVARALELGRWRGPVGRGLATAFAPAFARGLVRPGRVPPEIALVCVGGATLGGSGKTPVAIASARFLAGRGARVVLVGHAHKARPGRPRVVGNHDALSEVGDEALVCARALPAVPVVVAPNRQAALDHAARLSPDVIVLDGPLAVRHPPRRALSLLAVDADQPWGSSRTPPAGDLRAPRADLLALADHVVPVRSTPTRAGGEPIEALRGVRLGLFTAIARPDRLLKALAVVGIEPAVVVRAPDHGPGAPTSPWGRLSRMRARFRAPPEVEVWMATAKCALHLHAPAGAGRVVILEREPPRVELALEGFSCG